MKWNFLIKTVFIMIVFQLFGSVSFCQKQTINDNKVFFISITEINNLVIAYPYGCDDCSEGRFITEKNNLPYLDKFYPKDKNLFLFYPNCYELVNFPSKIRNYIVPYVIDSIKQILLNNYKYIPRSIISKKEMVFLENFRYLELTDHKYMIFLVEIEHYNKMTNIFFDIEKCYRFINESTYKGLYVKILVPIYD